MRSHLLLLPAALGLAACGQIGPPLPPSANLPAIPSKVQAVRRGPMVRLSWTASPRTSDGVRIRGPVAVNLCVWPAAPMAVSPPAYCPHPLALVGFTPVAGAGAVRQTAEISWTPLLRAAAGGAAVDLALERVGRQEVAAGWSAPVRVPLTPVGPPPAGVTARLVPEGVQLRWPALAPPPARILIYRRDLSRPQAAPALVGALAGATTAAVDRSVVDGHAYRYRLRSGAGAGAFAVESANSVPVTVLYRQTFPPAVPNGLRAVVTLPPGAHVDLSWNAESAPHLAGYNVYRRTGATHSWVRLNPHPLPTPVFEDPTRLPQGSLWRYAVSAVDEYGNESAKSEPVTAARP